MPLSATEFVPKEFYDLMTGAMKDQPVTFSNGLSVGGYQPGSSPGLRVYGGIDLFATPQDSAPGFHLGADGFVWPHAVVLPSLEISGDLSVHGTISGELPWDQFFSTYLRDLHSGTIAMSKSLVIGNIDPWTTNLNGAQAELVVRAPDLHGASSAISLVCWSGNWLQFNVRFWDADASQSWPAKRVTLDFDVDNMPPGTAGRITLGNGKVGIGQITDVEGAILELQRRLG